MYKSAEQALSLIKPGNRLFLHGGAATPAYLTNKLAYTEGLSGIEVVCISTHGDMPLLHESVRHKFFINTFFSGSNVREAIHNGYADYVPVFLSEIPQLFKSRKMPLDVALIQVSPPDKFGYCSLGVSVDVAQSAVICANTVIAQVNPFMPRTHGDGLIHKSKIDAMVYHEEPLQEILFEEKSGDVFEKIGKYAASLIEDGSTLQMGIGGVPNAVLKELGNHKDLGIHTEMFSDGIIELMRKGVITNKLKRKHPGKVVTGFAFGSQRLYDFVNDNPEFEFLESDYVNDPHVIRQNPKVCAINSAIEIDFTGQICADSIGTYMYSGVGGQMDFIRGASLSEGGKPIIALPSSTGKGISRIVPTLKPGASVVTTRAHAHYIITEYGVADLFGKNLKQRAHALIHLAHPDHREWLEKEAFERFRNF